MNIEFGDNVKILSSPETEKLGVSGLTGQVYGETTPSSTSVDVVGEILEDYAINVSLEEMNKTLWFAPQLLELIDHGQGTEITIGNIKAVRQADGSWEESKISPWWKFW